MLQSFEDARSFLLRVLPWTANEANTYKSIHWTFKPKDKPEKLLTGGSSQNVDDLLTMVQQEAGRADIYTALASFKIADVTSKTASGRDRRWPKPQRTQANVSTIKCLFIDLDVSSDPKKAAYRTQDEALNALVVFLKQASLPPPTIVITSGGGGFHIYWTFDRAVSLQMWQPLANALAEATKPERLNLLCDRQVTVDGARILRVPNTFNWKTGLPSPVTMIRNVPGDYSYEQLLQALTPYLTATRQTPNATITGMAAKFAEGIDESTAPPVDIRDTATRCAVFGEALATGGVNFAQPLWHLTMLAAAFAIDGRAVAHEMSKGHPNYTAQETDAMFDRKVRERQDRGLGWPRCSTFSRESAHCAKCPHFAADKTPFHFPTSSPSTPIEDDLPAGYYRSANNTIWVNTLDKDGDATSYQVMPYNVHDAWAQEDPDRLHFKLDLPSGKTIEVVVDNDRLASSHDLGSALPSLHIFVKQQQIVPVREFFVSWKQKLQQISSKQIRSSPYGWTTVNGRTGFTYAGKTWFGETDFLPAATADREIAKLFTPKGNMDKWREMVEVVLERNCIPLQTILAVAFAAPLVELSGQNGVLLSGYSRESGAGKTTTMRTAMAVWGNPYDGMNQLDDTPLHVANKMGILKSLPLLWDELKTKHDIEGMVRLAFQIGQGVEKGRLKSDTRHRLKGTWQTMMATTCNDSLMDQFLRATDTTDAALYRIFEFRITRMPYTRSTAEVESMLNDLRTNHGHAGLIYAKYIGEHRDNLKKIVLAMSKDLEQTYHQFEAERFWIAIMSTILVGASLAKALDLVNFDIQGIKDHLVETLMQLRKERSRTPLIMDPEQDAENIFGNYVGSLMPNRLLITDQVLKIAGRPRVKVKVLNRNVDRLDKVAAQIGRDDGIMRFSSVDFTQWCKTKDQPRQVILRELEKKYALRRVTGKLGGGTGLDWEYPIPIAMMEIELPPDQVTALLVDGAVLTTSDTSAKASAPDSHEPIPPVN